MTKFIMIQRFYLLIYKQIEDKKKRRKDLQREPDHEDFFDFLTEHGLDPDTKNMHVSAFKELLQEMDLVGTKNENWDYFSEDFDPDDEGFVSEERFEEDIKELLSHNEILVDSIFKYIGEYCQEMRINLKVQL